MGGVSFGAAWELKGDGSERRLKVDVGDRTEGVENVSILGRSEDCWMSRQTFPWNTGRDRFLNRNVSEENLL
jgi:hypothetical protein